MGSDRAITDHTGGDAGSDGDKDTSSILADAWRDWATRIDALDEDEWTTPTRCAGWVVRDLVAHVAPDPAALAALASMTMPGPAAVGDAAQLLRRFNLPDGVAHSMAEAVADQARMFAASRSRDDIRDSFAAAADLIDPPALAPSTVVPHPVAGSVTVEVLTEISLLEATAHLADLIAAVGGAPPSHGAVLRTGELLLRVVDPLSFIEVATGRVACDAVFPAIR